MRILNFGSLNIDHVYHVDHLTRAGETLTALDYSIGCGGKGLNQSVALAMAGAEVYHAGLIGHAGGFLRDRLLDSGVDCRFLDAAELPNGHAVIQVDKKGENAIFLFPGSNRALTEAGVDRVLTQFGRGDLLLVQNETNLVEHMIRRAASLGMDVAVNAAPMDETARALPLELIRWLIVNETECAALTGKNEPEAMAEALCGTYPNLELILTLGTDGSYYRKGDASLFIPAHRVEAVDTTGAGDTFTGYLLAAFADGADPGYAMTLATAAAALAVTRPGAADSIPSLEEVLQTL